MPHFFIAFSWFSGSITHWVFTNTFVKAEHELIEFEYSPNYKDCECFVEENHGRPMDRWLVVGEVGPESRAWPWCTWPWKAWVCSFGAPLTDLIHLEITWVCKCRATGGLELKPGQELSCVVIFAVFTTWNPWNPMGIPGAHWMRTVVFCS